MAKLYLIDNPVDCGIIFTPPIYILQILLCQLWPLVLLFHYLLSIQLQRILVCTVQSILAKYNMLKYKCLVNNKPKYKRTVSLNVLYLYKYILCLVDCAVEELHLQTKHTAQIIYKLMNEYCKMFLRANKNIPVRAAPASAPAAPPAATPWFSIVS